MRPTGALILILGLAGCSGSIGAPPSPYGRWYTTAGERLLIDKSKYTFCVVDQCQTGSVIPSGVGGVQLILFDRLVVSRAIRERTGYQFQKDLMRRGIDFDRRSDETERSLTSFSFFPIEPGGNSVVAVPDDCQRIACVPIGDTDNVEAFLKEPTNTLELR